MTMPKKTKKDNQKNNSNNSNKIKVNNISWQQKTSLNYKLVFFIDINKQNFYSWLVILLIP